MGAELGEVPTPFELGGMLLIGGALAYTSLWSLWQARRTPLRAEL